jgi:demethylmenaquinone methyltransferase/2-methoxy-6-polyprenyl-1,4-benzoquinol methylase
MPFDHFNLIAGLYDRGGQFNFSELMIGLFSLSPNHRVLDAGGGTGRIAAALRDMVREVLVVDVSCGMLRRAVKKELAAVCAPAEALPFPCGSFDRIVMMDALHHVYDQRQTIHELWRVLIPGGRIIIIEPDIRKFIVKMIALGEKALLMRSHFLNAKEIISLFPVPDARVGATYEEVNVFIVSEKARKI